MTASLLAWGEGSSMTASLLARGEGSSVTASLLAGGPAEEETKSNDEGYWAASSSRPMKPPDCRAQKRA